MSEQERQELDVDGLIVGPAYVRNLRQENAEARRLLEGERERVKFLHEENQEARRLLERWGKAKGIIAYPDLRTDTRDFLEE